MLARTGVQRGAVGMFNHGVLLLIEKGGHELGPWVPLSFVRTDSVPLKPPWANSTPNDPSPPAATVRATPLPDIRRAPKTLDSRWRW